MLGKTYSVIIMISVICAALNGKIDLLGSAGVNGAVNAIKFMLELGSMMALWCGITSVFEKCGALRIFSKAIRPFLKAVFPCAYKSGTAIDEISLNIGANFLGLGNAATPMGIRAVQKLAKDPCCSDDIVMLTVLNTASVQLIPTTLISLRMLSGSDKPYEIIVPIWISSVLTVIFAVCITKAFSILFRVKGKH